MRKNAGPQVFQKVSKVKNDSVLKIYLNAEQKSWVEALSRTHEVPMSKCIVNLIESLRNHRSQDEKLDAIYAKIENSALTQHAQFTISAPQNEILLAYIKEIFRESAANLFRINAIVAEFPEHEKVRAEVNNYVREQENTMRSKCAQIHEAYP